MLKFFLVVFLYLVFVSSFISKLNAGFFTKEITLDEASNGYSYFFTITDYIEPRDVDKKIKGKLFLLRSSIEVLILVEVPAVMTIEEQKTLWGYLEKLKNSMESHKYIFYVKFNGRLSKSIDGYRIHIYQR